MDGWSDLPSLLNTDFTPMADVEETDDEYLIEIELPGVHKNDIDISVAGQRVTVSGERKEKERAGSSVAVPAAWVDSATRSSCPRMSTTRMSRRHSTEAC